MRYFLVLLILLVCVAIYIHAKQPQLWDRLVAIVQSPKLEAAAAPSNDDTTNAAADDSPRPVPDKPIYISPDSKTYINPDHVRPVLQPGETNLVVQNSVSPKLIPPAAPAIPAPATTSTDALTSTSIPSTITTLSGKTYTGCVLSRATPDGISFTHSMGVAKVKFTDLDPAFAATFHYDPAAAQKFEQQQEANAAQSDQQRAAFVTSGSNAPPAAANSNQSALAPSVSSANAAPAPGASSVARLTPEQKDKLEDEIADLTVEIDRMKRDSADESSSTSSFSGPYSPANGTHAPYGPSGASFSPAATKGAYPAMIVQEQKQLNDLKAQLQADWGKPPLNPIMSVDARAAIKAQILTLKHDIVQLREDGQNQVLRPHLREVTKRQLQIDDCFSQLKYVRFYPATPLKLSPEDITSLKARALELVDYINRKNAEALEPVHQKAVTSSEGIGSRVVVGQPIEDELTPEKQQKFLEESIPEATEELAELSAQLAANNSPFTPASTQ